MPFELKWEAPGREPRRLLVIPCLLRKGREVTGLQVMLRGPAPRDNMPRDITTGNIAPGNSGPKKGKGQG